MRRLLRKGVYFFSKVLKILFDLCGIELNKFEVNLASKG